MGIQDSSVIIGDNKDWKAQIQKNQNVRQIKSSTSRQQEFYKIQNCKYPHQLIQNRLETNIQQHHTLEQHKKCTRKHQGYNKFNICNKCEQYPQKIISNKKNVYQRNTYKMQRPVKQSAYMDRQPYQQKQVGAPGPQTAGFYNGFSLPVQKYYRQKATISDFTKHQQMKGSIFREKNKQLQQSIYEQKQQIGGYERQYRGPVNIDFRGSQQILKPYNFK